MEENKLIISDIIPGEDVELTLVGEKSAATLEEKPDAFENGEAPYQIMEGCFYEYKITGGYCLEQSEIVSPSKFNDSSGRISPNIYVGTLNINVLNSDKIKCGQVKLEVQSVKTTYREDYRNMLEDITEKCTDLILNHNSLVSQNLTVDFNADSATLYQRFAFIKSVIDTEEFESAVHKVLSAPVTTWKENEIFNDIRRNSRFNNSSIRQLVSLSNRIDVPSGHPLKSILTSVPSKIKVNKKTESVDTPENRFVKHALFSFQILCSEFLSKLDGNSRMKNEAEILVEKIEQFLSHSVFKEISELKTFPLNSPILQRKEGYREILRVWLMFDLASRLVWHGGDDVYDANKRDVATLYEYWLFFKLLDIMNEVFMIEPVSVSNLIVKSVDGLGLNLKQGKYFPVKGVYKSNTRNLRVEFSYNRTFSGESEYPKGGSWSRALRPDYTLSIWPDGITQEEAEKEELIVHIHFDAKYRIEKLLTDLENDKELDLEKEEQTKGTYKSADILKMHTYRDAIRRTGGAYVLYPGSDKFSKQGFHEILPGLGAFPVHPSKSNDGTQEIKIFLRKVVAHFMNRASQREKISFKAYETYKNDKPEEINEALPESYGINRDLIPDDTYVLVAYYKKENWNWIIKSGLHNVRAGSDRGSLKLGPEEAGAKYLLLHSENETITGKILKVTERGPRIFSKKTLIEKGYPGKPSQDYYLVYKVKEVTDMEFLGINWDISKLKGFKGGRASALPFGVTLTELMKVKK